MTCFSQIDENPGGPSGLKSMSDRDGSQGAISVSREVSEITRSGSIKPLLVAFFANQ